MPSKTIQTALITFNCSASAAAMNGGNGGYGDCISEAMGASARAFRFSQKVRSSRATDPDLGPPATSAPGRCSKTGGDILAAGFCSLEDSEEPV